MVTYTIPGLLSSLLSIHDNCGGQWYVADHDGDFDIGLVWYDEAGKVIDQQSMIIPRDNSAPYPIGG